MTDPTKPDDRDLERYLEGDSALSRRYREASTEAVPPELDAAVLARARAAVRRPGRRAGWGTGLALAASLLLAVNLGWNVWRAEPVPDEAAAPLPPAPAAAPAPPPVAGEASAPEPVPEAKAKPPLRSARQRAIDAADSVKRERREAALREAERARQDESVAAFAARKSGADAAGAAAPAPAAALEPSETTDAQKIDRLIAFVAALEGAVFIRNGEEHTAAAAAQHLRMKREKAGERVRTADDFIRLCASYSSLTKEAYLIRFADGRTRTAEDVLREELKKMGSESN